jgi:hypothetical protein
MAGCFLWGGSGCNDLTEELIESGSIMPSLQDGVPWHATLPRVSPGAKIAASLLKKSERKANSVKDGSAGAKAQLILLTLLARLKPCRCYKAARMSCSASCASLREADCAV